MRGSPARWSLRSSAMMHVVNYGTCYINTFPFTTELVGGIWMNLGVQYSRRYIATSLGRPVDEYTFSADTLGFYKDLILHDPEFNRVFDLFQMIMRHAACPPQFTAGAASVFERCRLAYLIDTNRPATILPATTMQEGEAIRGALQQLGDAGLKGTQAHLRRASELINEGDGGWISPGEHSRRRVRGAPTGSRCV